MLAVQVPLPVRKFHDNRALSLLVGNTEHCSNSRPEPGVEFGGGVVPLQNEVARTQGLAGFNLLTQAVDPFTVTKNIILAW